jgi:hypothetical protein
MRQWISYEKKKRIEKREEGANTQEEKDKAFELAEKDIQESFSRIIKKAELLLRLNVPLALKAKQDPSLKPLSF